MVDSYIRLPEDSTGKKVDYTQITRDDGTVVERQRIEVYSESDQILSTSPIVDQLRQTNELLFSISMQMQEMLSLLGKG